MTFSVPVLNAQNLVPNPSFEEPTGCPHMWGQIHAATPWESATSASPDYFHECGINGWEVPANLFGYQQARTGQAYGGEVFRYSQPPNYREYIITPLSEPLHPGIAYLVGFWVSLADSSNVCPVTEFGAYFSAELPPDNSGIMGVTPQFKPTPGFVSDTQNWVLLSGCIIAEGGEQYMTIGNFSSYENTPLHPDCGTVWPDNVAYYYIDDVFVQHPSVEELEIELGETLVSCDTLLLDPGIPDVNYYWSTGSTDPFIEVSTTGLYAVTISRDCMIGTDSIYITIPDPVQVDIGPLSHDMCEDDQYEIQLDPQYEYTWQDGSTGSDQIITTGGLYQVTMDDGCYLSSDEILINIVSPPPAFTLDDDPVICDGWALLFSFDPSIGTFEWQDGSTDPEYYVSQPGEYALTITNLCGVESASAEITAQSTPAVSLGLDTSLCGSQLLEINLPFDPGIHDFTWSDNSNEPGIIIATPGMYAVTVTNACGVDIDSITVFFLSTPHVELGPDTAICSNSDSLYLDASNTTGATFLWQDSTTTSLHVVDHEGIYFVAAMNACGVDTDTVTVDFIDTLIGFTLGPDVAICPGEAITLSLHVSGASFFWQDSTTLDSIVVDEPGQYVVTAYNQCDSATDTVDVSINHAPPVVDLPPVVTLCQGQAVVVDAGVSGVNYIWNDNSTGSSLNITIAGVYSITVTNNCGDDTDSVTVIDGGPAPVIELGVDVSLCPGDTIVLTPTFADVDSWQWSGGETSTNIEITSGGITSVIVSNSCGTAYDTIHTELLPAVPIFTLGNDTAICAGAHVMLSISVPNVDITWSDGSTNTDLPVSSAGQYVATIANACGQFADTIQIDQLPAIPSLDLGNDQSLCPGELITIDPGIVNVDYLWNDGTNGSTYSTTQADTIILLISNSCGISTDTIFIIESTEGPQVDLGADIIGCEGDVVTIQSGISGVDYQWQDGSDEPSYTTNMSGEYILLVSNNCGSDTDTVLVDLSDIAPNVNLGTDTSLCDGEVLLLEINALPETMIEWQDGSSLQSFEITSPGNYYVTTTNDCGQASDTIAIVYTIAPLPFDLGNDTILCPGESITLVAPITTDDMQWQDGSTSPTFTTDQAQVYSLQISNACGVVADELQLSFISDQPIIDFDENLLFCPGDIISLDASQPFSAQYVWNTGVTSPQIDIVTPGIYSVTVFTDCVDIVQEVIIAASDACNPKTQFYIPNIFSPNGDGLNDVFEIQFNSTAKIESISGQLFDRWGNLLFSSQAIPFQWDGTSQGSPVNPGVYVYRFTLQYSNGVDVVTEVLIGDVTIIH